MTSLAKFGAHCDSLCSSILVLLSRLVLLLSPLSLTLFSNDSYVDSVTCFCSIPVFSTYLTKTVFDVDTPGPISVSVSSATLVGH